MRDNEHENERSVAALDRKRRRARNKVCQAMSLYNPMFITLTGVGLGRDEAIVSCKRFLQSLTKRMRMSHGFVRIVAATSYTGGHHVHIVIGGHSAGWSPHRGTVKDLAGEAGFGIIDFRVIDGDTPEQLVRYLVDHVDDRCDKEVPVPIGARSFESRRTQLPAGTSTQSDGQPCDSGVQRCPTDLMVLKARASETTSTAGVALQMTSRDNRKTQHGQSSRSTDCVLHHRDDHINNVVLIAAPDHVLIVSAMSDHSRKELEKAFNRGVQAGRVEVFLLEPMEATPWTRRVSMVFHRSVYHSLREFEAVLTRELRRLQSHRAAHARRMMADRFPRPLATPCHLTPEVMAREELEVVHDASIHDETRMACLQSHLEHQLSTPMIRDSHGAATPDLPRSALEL